MELAIIKDRNKSRGLIATIIFHLILALLFIYFGLTYSFPPPEQGILINFGTSSEGMGDIQPDQQGNKSKEATESLAIPTEENTKSENVETALTSEESVITTPAENEEQKKKREEEELKKQKEEEFNKKLDDVWAKSENEGGNEGETGKPGDQGNPDGSKSSKSHIGGTLPGNGHYRLNGRSLVFAPVVIEKSQKEGVVLVSIIVDKKGNVVEATPGVKGSTTADRHLWKVARNAALQYKFNPNLYAPEEQLGEISFTFILK